MKCEVGGESVEQAVQVQALIAGNVGPWRAMCLDHAGAMLARVAHEEHELAVRPVDIVSVDDDD